MNNRIVIIAVAIFLAAGIGFFFWTKSTTPKIAYVRSAVIVEGYHGMKEAKNLYKEKMGKWQSNIDTLESDYQRTVSKYNLDLPKLSEKEKKEREESLKKQEVNIRQYVSSLEEKAKQEDEKMTQGVLNQINSFVKGYGEKKGYDLILGVTIDGNILYGNDAIDITDEILKEMNASYKNSPAETKN